MTDVQLLTLAIAVIVPLSLLIYSNSRISDAKDSMRQSLTEAKETLRADIQALENRIDGRLSAMQVEMTETRSAVQRIEADLREFFKIQAEHDKRITRLEDQK